MLQSSKSTLLLPSPRKEDQSAGMLPLKNSLEDQQEFRDSTSTKTWSLITWQILIQAEILAVYY